MKRLLSFILACTLLTSTISAIPTIQERHELIKQAESKYEQFKKELNEYWRCIKRDKNCDPKKSKQIKITAAILGATIGAIAIGTIGKLALPKLARSNEKIKAEIKNFIGHADKNITTITASENGWMWTIHSKKEIGLDDKDDIEAIIKRNRLWQVKAITFVSGDDFSI